MANFVLTRPLADPRLNVEALAPYYDVHKVRPVEPADVDDRVRQWYAEAHQVGNHSHATDPGWPRVPTTDV